MSLLWGLASPLRLSVKPARDKGYLAFIRRQPCAVCGSSRGVEAAHQGGHGLGQKASDHQTIPLCRAHHQRGSDSYNALGPRQFAEAHGLDIPALIAGFQLRGGL